jgi:CPA2 family monovalent cation:H+ antiporter-2
MRNRSGASILTIKRGEELIPNPDPIWELQDGDIVLLLGTSDQLAAAGRLFEPGSIQP